MAASREKLSEWFARGAAQGATHLIVVCDTFDYVDYPVFARSDAEAEAEYRYYSGARMQRVMEVYDLREDKEQQMRESRTMRLPKQPNTM